MPQEWQRYYNSISRRSVKIKLFSVVGRVATRKGATRQFIFIIVGHPTEARPTSYEKICTRRGEVHLRPKGAGGDKLHPYANVLFLVLSFLRRQKSIVLEKLDSRFRGNDSKKATFRNVACEDEILQPFDKLMVLSEVEPKVFISFRERKTISFLLQLSAPTR